MEKRDFLKICAAGALIAAPVMASGCERSVTDAPPDGETSFQRLLRTRTIRTSYATYAPAVMVDPNTKERSGIFVDLITMIGQRLGMQVDWGEEVGWGEIAEGFKLRRYDICTANVWPTSSRAKTANFTVPSYFSAMYAYVRPGDESRFKTYADIDDPGVTVAAQDDDGITDIVKARFPRAKLLSFSQGIDTKQRLMNVASGKADITFDDAYFAQLFMEANPGAVERLNIREPVQVFANTFMFDNDDWRTKLLLDTALEELHNAGAIDALVEKYTGRKDTFLSVAKPYALPVQ